MELPLGGPALRHYTQSRPRPHRQKLNYRPSRPQETIFESENEVLEHMGRVDEGVEEFFTKKVLPLDILKKQEEEEITVQEVVPASSNPCPAPTKTLRRKLGDFFTLKKRRGSKTETTHDGRPKKASIADLIRPLREVARAEKEKDKDRVKEHDKENEKEKGESAAQEAPVSGAPPLRGETAPPRRALREGKSQSLILLSGSAAGTPNSRNATKKQMEGQHSFEQKLHLMLQRIGVAKPQPAETQNQEREMKKAESEGTIIDSKPEPPPSLSKPRTMSASSDTRHQIRPSVSEHESAGKPPLLPKPVIKPGPANTTSGNNTPENELTLQEGEINAHTKQSPGSTSSPPVAADSQTSTSTTSSVPTISNSVSDSSSAAVSPSSTAAHTGTEICTDSVKPIEQDSTATTLIEPDSKFTEDSVTTTEPPTDTILTSSTSTATPSEAPGANIISSESVTQSFSDTSNVTSTTTASPSIVTVETVCQVNSGIEVFKLSTESTVPEVNGNLSHSAAAAAAGDAAVAFVNTASSSSTSLVAESVVTTTECETSISTVSKPLTPFISSNLNETAVSIETLVSTSSTQMSTPTLPVISNLSSPAATASTKSPTSSESVTTIAHADTPTPSVSSTCNAVTEPGDITLTTTISLNDADTTTSQPSTTAVVSSTLSINSDPAHTDTDPVPADNISINDQTRGISDGSASPAHSKDSPDRNVILQPSEDDAHSSKPTEKKAEEKFEIDLEKTEEDKEQETSDVQRANEIAPIVSSEEMEGTGRKESDSAKETMATTPSGKEGECGTNEDPEDGKK